MSHILDLVAHTAPGTGEGGVTVTVFTDREGADESVRAAREQAGEIASNRGIDPPAISEGSVLLRL